MDYKAIDKLAAIGCDILIDEPMCRHTTFRIGGVADRLVNVYSNKQLVSVLRAAEGMPLFMLGNGSNVLVSDKGFRGVVVRLNGDFNKIVRDGNEITAGAAVTLSSLCRFAQNAGLSGLEFAYGIPGTVGGALYMNAGAYGGEIKDVVAGAISMDLSGNMQKHKKTELRLSYRHSCFQDAGRIITEMTVLLKPGNSDDISKKMETLMSKRIERQPYNMPSAGSTFKRPEGYFAAALIEACGLKGCSIGGARVSEKHAGFIINTGDAVCEDILLLIKHVQEKVLEKKNVRLECEIYMIGEGF